MVLSRHTVGEATAIMNVQEDLKTLGFYRGAIDGDFGPMTLEAVREFQQRYFVDGVVDSHTEISIINAIDSRKKTKPSLLVDPPRGLHEIEAMFGKFDYTSKEGGVVDILDDFESRNIVEADLPVVGVTLVHMGIASILRSVLSEVVKRGLEQTIQQFWCFTPRHKMWDVNRQLSTHAWGIAVDINWTDNPPGALSSLDPELVAIFELHGFEWGGRWRQKDCMHFQFARDY